MRLASFVSGFSFLATIFSSTFADETVVKVTSSFPSDNPFGRVVNGEHNVIDLFIENNTKQNVTLLSIASSFHNSWTHSLLKSIPATEFNLKLPEGDKLSVQYPFYSRLRLGDARLKVWLDVVDETRYRVSAHDSIVTVVEPKHSPTDWPPVKPKNHPTDWQFVEPEYSPSTDQPLWATYLIILGILGCAGYYILPYFQEPEVYDVYILYVYIPPRVRALAAEPYGGKVSSREGTRRRRGRK